MSETFAIELTETDSTYLLATTSGSRGVFAKPATAAQLREWVQQCLHDEVATGLVASWLVPYGPDEQIGTDDTDDLHPSAL